MGWNDINFDLIVTGMITKGPAEVSFAEYLNTFSRALDERLNMLISAADETYPELPNIVFEVGEIRAVSAGPFISNFWVKLKDMIGGYYGIWNQYEWYTIELMTDPVNHAAYKLEDADLIAIIGQETFDIISNISGSTVSEYFTADVLNALYEIYKLTKYTRITYGAFSTPLSAPAWGSTSRDFTENKGAAAGGTLSSEEAESFSASNTIAYTRYSTDYSTAPANLFGAIADIDTRANNLTVGLPNTWSVSYSQGANGLSLHSRYRDLNDTLLNMEVNASLQVVRNLKTYRQNQSGPAIPYGGYNSNFSQVGQGELPIEDNSSPLLLDTIHQLPFGTVNTWAANGGEYLNPAIPSKVGLFLPPTGNEAYEDNQFFEVVLNFEIATNINNSDLEFFIA